MLEAGERVIACRKDATIEGDFVPTERIEEISDRIGEIEHALPGLLERRPEAAKYVARELKGLLAECEEAQVRWSELVSRARSLVERLGESECG